MDTNLTVFISNLSFEVEENKVRAVFEKVNKLLKENYKVQIVTDYDIVCKTINPECYSDCELKKGRNPNVNYKNIKTIRKKDK